MAADDRNFAVGIVPLDAPLASFGDINRGRWPGEFQPQTGTIFSYAMNNYWDTNYRAGQGGNFSFRYAVTSGPKLDGSTLTRLAMDEMRPVELNHVVEQDKAGDPSRPLPPTGEGFLETSGRNVALITWKQAEDGKGTIMRLVEIAGQVSETTVHFFRSNVTAARLCSGVEDDGENLPISGNSVHLSFHPFEVQTVRVISK
jgi:alpha-mannosidase